MSVSQVETSVSSVEKFKLVLVILLLLVATVGYYYFADQVAIKFAFLLGGIVCALALFFAATDAGKNLLNFAKESSKEMHKVVWPQRKEAINMTLYVLGFVVLLSFFMWVVDKLLTWGIFGLILGWR